MSERLGSAIFVGGRGPEVAGRTLPAHGHNWVARIGDRLRRRDGIIHRPHFSVGDNRITGR